MLRCLWFIFGQTEGQQVWIDDSRLIAVVLCEAGRCLRQLAMRWLVPRPRPHHHPNLPGPSFLGTDSHQLRADLTS